MVVVACGCCAGAVDAGVAEAVAVQGAASVYLAGAATGASTIQPCFVAVGFIVCAVRRGSEAFVERGVAFEAGAWAVVVRGAVVPGGGFAGVTTWPATVDAEFLAVFYAVVARGCRAGLVCALSAQAVCVFEATGSCFTECAAASSTVFVGFVAVGFSVTAVWEGLLACSLYT